MRKKGKLPSRKKIRLQGYDYSQPGQYFITICTEKRICQFGKIITEQMILNDAGEMAQQIWENLPKRFSCVVLDDYQMMPNHIHGIIVINPSNVEISHKNRVNLFDIVGAFKSITTDLYIMGVGLYNWPRFPGKLWQAKFYDHIIRNDEELNRIREYIKNNPIQWAFDRENPFKDKL